jgi:hypothetical protein
VADSAPRRWASHAVFSLLKTRQGAFPGTMKIAQLTRFGNGSAAMVTIRCCSPALKRRVPGQNPVDYRRRDSATARVITPRPFPTARNRVPLAPTMFATFATFAKFAKFDTVIPHAMSGRKNSPGGYQFPITRSAALVLVGQFGPSPQLLAIGHVPLTDVHSGAFVQPGRPRRVLRIDAERHSP